MDAISLRNVQSIMPGVKAITYKSAYKQLPTGMTYNVFSVPRARKKKVSKVQDLIEDADLSQIYVIWQIFTESMEAASLVSGTGTLTALKPNDFVIDGDKQWGVKRVLEHKLLDNCYNLLCQLMAPSS